MRCDIPCRHAFGRDGLRTSGTASEYNAATPLRWPLDPLVSRPTCCRCGTRRCRCCSSCKYQESVNWDKLHAGPCCRVPNRLRGRRAYYDTGTLEGGQVGHLLDRSNDRLQTLHIPSLADFVSRQTVNRRAGGEQKQQLCDIALLSRAQQTWGQKVILYYWRT